MAATEAPNKAGTVMQVSEANIAAHHERMAQKRAERSARLPEHIRCLDAEHAGNVEAAKPRFRFAIECTIQEHDPKLKPQLAVKKSGEVEAHSEEDAWAKFCDKWKVRTGPNHCNRQIRKLSPKQAA